MAKDTPRKLFEDIKKTLDFHSSLGLGTYIKSDALQSFLEIPEPSKPSRLDSLDGLTETAAKKQKIPQTAPVNTVQKTLEDIRRELGDCTRCGLHEGRTRILFGAGPPDAQLLVVGEWPNRIDDAEGVLFSDKEGGLLRKMLQAIDINLEETYRTNIIKCRASEENPPQKEHISACRPFSLAQIDVIAPKVILTMGPLAAQVMLSTNKLLVRLRGRVYRYKKTPLVPTFHPSYLIKNPEMKKAAWIDLQLVQRELSLQ